jgi:hypothetical protein
VVTTAEWAPRPSVAALISATMSWDSLKSIHLSAPNSRHKAFFSAPLSEKEGEREVEGVFSYY